MADFTYRGTVGGAEPEEKQFNVASGTTASIAVGDIVVVANGYAALVADAEGVSGERLALAISDSDETAVAAGTVVCSFSTDGLVAEGIATTPANLLPAVLFDKVTLDVAAGVITVDENDPNGIVTIYELDSDSATTGVCRVILPWSIEV